METLDFFGDGFRLTTLIDAINHLPFVPGQAGALLKPPGVGVTTDNVSVERKDGLLTLIPTTPRSAPPVQLRHAAGNLRRLVVPHVAAEDALLASEIQGIRGFGTTQPQAWQEFVTQRMAEHTPKFDATQEYGVIGAVKGVILDADGSSVIYNLFSEFGVTQTVVDFTLGTAAVDVEAKCTAVTRAIKKAVGQGGFLRIHAFVGPVWMDRFKAHPVIKAAYDRWRDGEFNRTAKTAFEIFGITFEEYEGEVNGIKFVADNEAHFFPVGVAGLFQTYFSPADFVETVNTKGLPRYAKMERMQYDRGFTLLMESNQLTICRKPECLVKGVTTN